jgi:hypothetical protein
MDLFSGESQTPPDVRSPYRGSRNPAGGWKPFVFNGTDVIKVLELAINHVMKMQILRRTGSVRFLSTCLQSNACKWCRRGGRTPMVLSTAGF